MKIRVWKLALALGVPGFFALVLIVRFAVGGSSPSDRRAAPEAQSSQPSDPPHDPVNPDSPPSALGIPKAEDTGEPVESTLESPSSRLLTTLESTIEQLELLYENGKIKEGYEACRSLIKSPVDNPDGFVRRLVGLRALALFSPEGVSWRQEAYEFLTSVAKDTGSQAAFRKESIAALLGLHSLNINVNSFFDKDLKLPIAPMLPEAALDYPSRSHLVGKDILTRASFADLASKDKDLRQWLAEVALTDTVVPAFDFANDAFETRLAAIAGCASLRDAEGLRILRELAGAPADPEGVQRYAVRCMLGLVARGQRELYPDVMNALEKTQDAMVLLSFAERIPRFEKKYTPHVDLLLGRLADFGSKDERVEFRSRSAARQAFNLIQFYYPRRTTTPEQKLQMRTSLFTILTMVPSWEDVPAEMELLVMTNFDPVTRDALEQALKSGPNASNKRRCLEILRQRKR